MKIYFCWEQSYTGVWQPACYHGWFPDSKGVNGQGMPRTTPVEVTKEFVDESGEPRFAKLSASYPAPHF
jgi:hypothetical protein